MYIPFGIDIAYRNHRNEQSHRRILEKRKQAAQNDLIGLQTFTQWPTRLSNQVGWLLKSRMLNRCLKTAQVVGSILMCDFKYVVFWRGFLSPN